MQCPYCNFENQAGEEFCAWCGGELAGTGRVVRCPNCGKINPVTVAYCLRCGNCLRAIINKIERAQLLLSKRKYKQAQKAFEEILKLVPEDENVKSKLAEIDQILQKQQSPRSKKEVRRVVLTAVMALALAFVVKAYHKMHTEDLKSSKRVNGKQITNLREEPKIRPHRDRPPMEEVENIAPNFTLADLSGNQVSLSDFKDKVVILDFWATWCGPCVSEIPHFVELYEQYSKEGLEIIGIALDKGGAEVVKPFTEKHKVNYIVLIGNREVMNAYGGIPFIPTTFVIDSKGKIYRKYGGYKSKSVFEEDVKTLLQLEGQKITKEMADNYVKASCALMKAIQAHAKRMDEFRETYGLSTKLTELTDSVYRAKHPEVIRAWQVTQRRWEKDEKEAYESAGINQDEFRRIASALKDPINSEIVKQIEEKLEALQEGAFECWTKAFGGTNYDAGRSVQQTSDGGYIITGSTYSFGKGRDDVYIIKTDANGNILWTKAYGGKDHDVGVSVQQTFDGGYIIVGDTYSFGAGGFDVYLLKTDANGDTLWTKTYGGTCNDAGYSVQQTSDDGYVVAGWTCTGGGQTDVYLLKMNINGDIIWAKTYGGTNSDYGYSVQQTSDGGYIIAGHTLSFGAGSRDVYVIKTDASGESVWTRTYGGTYTDYGYSVQQTSDGGYIITGETSSFGAGSWDIYVIKTDANGDSIWAKTYGGINNDAGESVQQTTDGGYIIAGYTASFGSGSRDVYLIKTDANGDVLWRKTYGGTKDDIGRSVQQTSDGGYIIAGATYSFGSGSRDVYLIKTDAEGRIGWNSGNERTLVGQN